MKKSLSLLALTAAFFAAGVFAADKAAETKVANCCTKAKTEGKTCSHACCVESAKAGNNCTKCGGAGKIEAKK